MVKSSQRPRSAGLIHRVLLPVRVVRAGVTLALPIVFVAGVVLAHGASVDSVRDTRPALTVGAGAQSVADLQSGAADHLATALAKGGSGISFTIVQRSTVRPKAGGAELLAPDPADPAKSVVVDEAPFGSLTELGTATAAGFYAELREGPAPGKEPDWTTAPAFQALTRDGVVYRNEGKGWYETDNPPGVGLDPASIALLPGVIGDAREMTDAGVDAKDPSVRNLSGTARLADIPGLIAADGKAFTELTDPVTYRLDPDGKLVGLHLVARNTNLKAYDLVVETDITLAYVAGDLPEPKPALKDSEPVVVP